MNVKIFPSLFPSFSGQIPDDEWNLLYVAVTRAKTSLIVTKNIRRIITAAGVGHTPQRTNHLCSFTCVWYLIITCEMKRDFIYRHHVVILPSRTAVCFHLSGFQLHTDVWNREITL